MAPSCLGGPGGCPVPRLDGGAKSVPTKKCVGVLAWGVVLGLATRASSDTTEATVTWVLQPGWNLVAVPFSDARHRGAQAALFPLVWPVTASSRPAGEPSGAASTMGRSQRVEGVLERGAYWVHSHEAQTWVVEGRLVVSSSTTAHSGWRPLWVTAPTRQQDLRRALVVGWDPRKAQYFSLAPEDVLMPGIGYLSYGPTSPSPAGRQRPAPLTPAGRFESARALLGPRGSLALVRGAVSRFQDRTWAHVAYVVRGADPAGDAQPEKGARVLGDVGRERDPETVGPERRGDEGDVIWVYHSAQAGRPGSFVPVASFAASGVPQSIVELSIAARDARVAVSWIGEHVEDAEETVVRQLWVVQSMDGGQTFGPPQVVRDNATWKQGLDMAYDHHLHHHLVWGEGHKAYYLKNLSGPPSAVFDVQRRAPATESVSYLVKSVPDENGRCACPACWCEESYLLSEEPNPDDGSPPTGPYVYRTEESYVYQPSLAVSGEAVTIVAHKSRMWDNRPVLHDAWQAMALAPRYENEDASDLPWIRRVVGWRKVWKTAYEAGDEALYANLGATFQYRYRGTWHEQDEIVVAQRPLAPDAWPESAWRENVWVEDRLQSWRLTTLAAVGGDQGDDQVSYPRVAAAPWGLVAVYEDGLADGLETGGAERVRVQSSSDGGVSWSAPRTVGAGTMPVVGAGQSGQLSVLAYAPRSTSGGAVWAVNSEEDKALFGPPAFLNQGRPKRVHRNRTGTGTMAGGVSFATHEDLSFAAWIEKDQDGADRLMTTRASPLSEAVHWRVNLPAYWTEGQRAKVVVTAENAYHMPVDAEHRVRLNHAQEGVKMAAAQGSFQEGQAELWVEDPTALVPDGALSQGVLKATPVALSRDTPFGPVVEVSLARSTVFDAAVAGVPLFSVSARGNYEKARWMRDRLWRDGGPSPSGEPMGYQVEYQGVGQDGLRTDPGYILEEEASDAAYLAAYERVWAYTQGIALAQYAREGTLESDARAQALARYLCARADGVSEGSDGPGRLIRGWPFSWNTLDDAWKDARLVTGATAWVIHGLGAFLVSPASYDLSPDAQERMRQCYREALKGLEQHRHSGTTESGLRVSLMTAGWTTRGLQNAEHPWRLQPEGRPRMGQEDESWDYYDVLDAIGYRSYNALSPPQVMRRLTPSDGAPVQLAPRVLTQVDVRFLKEPVRANNVVTEHNLDVLSVLNHALVHSDALGVEDRDVLERWRNELRNGIFYVLWDQHDLHWRRDLENARDAHGSGEAKTAEIDAALLEGAWGRVATGGEVHLASVGLAGDAIGIHLGSGERLDFVPNRRHTAIDNCSWLSLSVHHPDLGKEAEAEALARCLEFTTLAFAKTIGFRGRRYYGAHYFFDGFEDRYIAATGRQEESFHLEATTGLILGLLRFVEHHPEHPRSAFFAREAEALWAGVQSFVTQHDFPYSSQRILNLSTRLTSSTAIIWFIDTFRVLETFPENGGTGAPSEVGLTDETASEHPLWTRLRRGAGGSNIEALRGLSSGPWMASATSGEDERFVDRSCEGPLGSACWALGEAPHQVQISRLASEPHRFLVHPLEEQCLFHLENQGGQAAYYRVLVNGEALQTQASWWRDDMEPLEVEVRAHQTAQACGIVPDIQGDVAKVRVENVHSGEGWDYAFLVETQRRCGSQEGVSGSEALSDSSMDLVATRLCGEDRLVLTSKPLTPNHMKLNPHAAAKAAEAANKVRTLLVSSPGGMETAAQVAGIIMGLGLSLGFGETHLISGLVTWYGWRSLRLYGARPEGPWKPVGYAELADLNGQKQEDIVGVVDIHAPREVGGFVPTTKLSPDKVYAVVVPHAVVPLIPQLPLLIVDPSVSRVEIYEYLEPIAMEEPGSRMVESGWLRPAVEAGVQGPDDDTLSRGYEKWAKNGWFLLAVLQRQAWFQALSAEQQWGYLFTMLHRESEPWWPLLLAEGVPPATRARRGMPSNPLFVGVVMSKRETDLITRTPVAPQRLVDGMSYTVVPRKTHPEFWSVKTEDLSKLPDHLRALHWTSPGSPPNGSGKEEETAVGLSKGGVPHGPQDLGPSRSQGTTKSRLRKTGLDIDNLADSIASSADGTCPACPALFELGLQKLGRKSKERGLLNTFDMGDPMAAERYFREVLDAKFLEVKDPEEAIKILDKEGPGHKAVLRYVPKDGQDVRYKNLVNIWFDTHWYDIPTGEDVAPSGGAEYTLMLTGKIDADLWERSLVQINMNEDVRVQYSKKRILGSPTLDSEKYQTLKRTVESVRAEHVGTTAKEDLSQLWQVLDSAGMPKLVRDGNIRLGQDTTLVVAVDDSDGVKAVNFSVAGKDYGFLWSRNQSVARSPLELLSGLLAMLIGRQKLTIEAKKSGKSIRLASSSEELIVPVLSVAERNGLKKDPDLAFQVLLNTFLGFERTRHVWVVPHFFPEGEVHVMFTPKADGARISAIPVPSSDDPQKGKILEGRATKLLQEGVGRIEAGSKGLQAIDFGLLFSDLPSHRQKKEATLIMLEEEGTLHEARVTIYDAGAAFGRPLRWHYGEAELVYTHGEVRHVHVIALLDDAGAYSTIALGLHWHPLDNKRIGPGDTVFQTLEASTDFEGELLDALHVALPVATQRPLTASLKEKFFGKGVDDGLLQGPLSLEAPVGVKDAGGQLDLGRLRELIEGDAFLYQMIEKLHTANYPLRIPAKTWRVGPYTPSLFHFDRNERTIAQTHYGVRLDDVERWLAVRTGLGHEIGHAVFFYIAVAANVSYAELVPHFAEDTAIQEILLPYTILYEAYPDDKRILMLTESMSWWLTLFFGAMAEPNPSSTPFEVPDLNDTPLNRVGLQLLEYPRTLTQEELEQGAVKAKKLIEWVSKKTMTDAEAVAYLEETNRRLNDIAHGRAPRRPYLLSPRSFFLVGGFFFHDDVLQVLRDKGYKETDVEWGDQREAFEAIVDKGKDLLKTAVR